MGHLRAFSFQSFRHTRTLSPWSPAQITRRLSTPPSTPPPPRWIADRVAAKLPKRLHSYAERFADKPLSHITSFLLLHEITAIVPIAGLFWFFHSTNWSPSMLSGNLIAEGVERFGRYTEKKGWEIFKGEQGAKLVLEIAMAWAVVKAMLPVRIAACFWATPWFARAIIGPISGLFSRTKRR